MNAQEFIKLHNKIQKLKTQGVNNLTPKQREWYLDNIEYYNFLRLFPQNQNILQNTIPAAVSATVKSKELTAQQQAEKLELIRKIKKLEQSIAWTEKDLAKISPPDRVAGDWSNIDYEDKVQLIASAKQRLEKYKQELEAYETQ